LGKAEIISGKSIWTKLRERRKWIPIIFAFYEQSFYSFLLNTVSKISTHQTSDGAALFSIDLTVKRTGAVVSTRLRDIAKSYLR